MTAEPPQASSTPLSSPELVFGLVGAIGTDLDHVFKCLANALDAVGYSSKLIKVSDLIRASEAWHDPKIQGLDDHVEQYQIGGNNFRKALGRPDALALASILNIRHERRSMTNDAGKPADRQAYVIRSLKRKEEAEALRKVYGTGFFLIAAYSSKEMRIKKFAGDIANSRGNSLDTNKYLRRAEDLIETDQAESNNEEYGQNVRDTYPLADVFLDASDRNIVEVDIGRFINILFGHPFITPKRDEYFMFHAQAAALRSADPSRQVGAAVADKFGNVVAVGTNEVPKVGGGLYWEGDSPDNRDFQLEVDLTAEMRKDTLREVLERLETHDWLDKEKMQQAKDKLLEIAVPLMKGTKLMGLGEYGRIVHAEMAAMLDAARRGISLNESVLYTTTFPCHNCAKHILATGISKVIYIEPYPKSLADTLHSNEINDNSREVSPGKIAFGSFVGIAPRQYMSLFSMADRKRKGGKKALESWMNSKKQTKPRFPLQNAHLAYVPREVEAVVLLAPKE